MFESLQILPLIFYFITVAIYITYQIYVGNYKIQPTKKLNIICLILVILFGILSIASTVLFWLLY